MVIKVKHEDKNFLKILHHFLLQIIIQNCTLFHVICSSIFLKQKLIIILSVIMTWENQIN